MQQNQIYATKRQERSTIIIAGKEVEDVNNFVYLGATVSSTGGTNEDIRRRLSRKAFYSSVKYGTVAN